MRKSVKVCVRTRPTQFFAQDNIIIDEQHSTIQVSTSLEEPTGVLNNRKDKFKFKFDHVFHNATQSSVYDLYGRQTVQSVVDGINGAIMTYGQTGSGKSFTMMGDTASYEHRGIASRAIGQLFSEINSRMELEYTIACTYMEIYNERIFDLLSDLSNPDIASDFTIAEDKDGKGTFVRGLTEIEVKNETEALNLIFSGELSRTTAQHKLNRKSNRSHSIFTIYLQQRQRSGVSEKIGHSKLHLIDLAGSERLKKTMDNVDGTTLDSATKKESMSINQSLTFLEQCVVALSRRSSHVPYRQSKLTNILKDSLGANCNTIMIACIWGEDKHLEETVSTLRLASRMMQVHNEVSSVETTDTATLIKKQSKIIKALKQELLMHDALVDRTGMQYEPYTPEQSASVGRMVEKYIDAPIADDESVLDINSYRQMLEVCKVFKKLVLSAREDAVLARSEVGVSNTFEASSSLNASGGLGEGKRDTFDASSPMLGESEGVKKGGFSLGSATSDSRPSGGIEGVSRYNDSKNSNTSFGGTRAKDQSPSPTKSPGARAMVGFSPESKTGSGSPGGDMLDDFIRGDGKLLHNDYMECKSVLRELKSKIRDITQLVNDAKINIDKLQMDVESRKSYRIEILRKSGLKASETEDIVDEEEFTLMKELREAKRTYKNSFESLQKIKQSASHAQQQTDDSKANLGAAFADWQSKINNFDAVDEFEDTLDDQEMFDKLELDRVMANDPDSLAFFNAQKTQRTLVTQNSGAIKTMQKNKRFN